MKDKKMVLLNVAMFLVAMFLVAIPAIAYPDPILTVTTDKQCYQPGDNVKVNVAYDGNHIPPCPVGCSPPDCEWPVLDVWSESLNLELKDMGELVPGPSCLIVDNGVECGYFAPKGAIQFATYKIKDTVLPGSVGTIYSTGHFLVATTDWSTIPPTEIFYQKIANGDVLVRVCEPTPSPEFPSMLLPVAMIIGFLGAVLLIQRTREQ